MTEIELYRPKIQVRQRRLTECALALALVASLLSAEGVGAIESPSASSPTYVLILFLYDLNKNYHVLRAGTYTSAGSCNKSGQFVLTALNRGNVKNQNYMCLEADLPY
jgi:hypothetical protein